MKLDVLVLGAGMVGISAALALQARGRTVGLVDRRGPAEETSFGNAGVIQREAILPYAFQRDWRVLAGAALDRRTDVRVHLRALPAIAGPLLGYARHGTPERIAATARAARPLVERCLDEHRTLMTAAGAEGLARPTGYLKLYRSAPRWETALREQEDVRARYGVAFEALDPAQLAALEPHLARGLAGGLLMTDPVSVSDPGALGQAYAALFAARGGRLITADARTLTADGARWLVRTIDGPVSARDAVIALGPWSGEVVAAVAGRRVPLFVKRGYHRHFRQHGNVTLGRPVIDVEAGFVMAPMARGLRVTTGAELGHIEAPPTPVQLARVEPLARGLLPLGESLDPVPWLGRRPCLPDMLPMIGPVPGHAGLWADFGHHHLGFTLGPVTARLLAEIMTGAEPFTDPRPYRIDRF